MKPSTSINAMDLSAFRINVCTPCGRSTAKRVRNGWGLSTPSSDALATGDKDRSARPFHGDGTGWNDVERSIVSTGADAVTVRLYSRSVPFRRRMERVAWNDMERISRYSRRRAALRRFSIRCRVERLAGIPLSLPPLKGGGERGRPIPAAGCGAGQGGGG